MWYDLFCFVIHTSLRSYLFRLQAPEILNSKSFQDVLAFQRGSKHKERDIESPSTAIRNIKECAKAIEEDLTKQLQVRSQT